MHGYIEIAFFSVRKEAKEQAFGLIIWSSSDILIKASP